MKHALYLPSGYVPKIVDESYSSFARITRAAFWDCEDADLTVTRVTLADFEDPIWQFGHVIRDDAACEVLGMFLVRGSQAHPARWSRCFGRGESFPLNGKLYAAVAKRQPPY